jgi:hypothetical protein
MPDRGRRLAARSRIKTGPHHGETVDLQRTGDSYGSQLAPGDHIVVARVGGDDPGADLLDHGRLDGKPGGLSPRTVRYIHTII